MTSLLYQINDNKNLTDKQKVKRLNLVLNEFERNTKHLSNDMIIYHTQDSNSLKLNNNQQVFHHLNMEFKYILN